MRSELLTAHQDINRRIGGLEIAYKALVMLPHINRRIGGLEKSE